MAPNSWQGSLAGTTQPSPVPAFRLYTWNRVLLTWKVKGAVGGDREVVLSSIRRDGSGEVGSNMAEDAVSRKTGNWAKGLFRSSTYLASGVRVT